MMADSESRAGSSFSERGDLGGFKLLEMITATANISGKPKDIGP